MISKPYHDYTDLALTLSLGIVSAYFYGDISQFTTGSDLVISWILVAAPILLITYQTLTTSEVGNKWVKLGIKLGTVVLMIFMIYAILIAIVVIVAAAIGGMNAKNAEKGESLAEYTSRRERQERMADGTAQIGGAALTGMSFATVFLTKYVVEHTKFSPITKWFTPSK